MTARWVNPLHLWLHVCSQEETTRGGSKPVLLANAKQAEVSAGHADAVERVLLLHSGGDLHRGWALLDRWHRQERTCVLCGLLKISHLRVTSLGLGTVAGEDNQLSLVLLESLHVELQRLSGAVPPAVVNRNANSPRLLPVEARLLELIKGEATPLAQLVVVLDGRRVHNRAQQTRRRARGNRSRLCLAHLAPALLAGGLVEPRLHVVLPAYLVEVRIGDNVVTLHHTACEGGRHRAIGQSSCAIQKTTNYVARPSQPAAASGRQGDGLA